MFLVEVEAVVREGSVSTQLVNGEIAKISLKARPPEVLCIRGASGESGKDFHLDKAIRGSSGIEGNCAASLFVCVVVRHQFPRRL